jgi:hypothetical protein
MDTVHRRWLFSGKAPASDTRGNSSYHEETYYYRFQT